MDGYLAFLIALGVMSVLALAVYGADKLKAKREAWRVPEKVLLGLGFFGGAVGALLAMQVFRHKTRHWYFWVVNILGLAWQVATEIYLLLAALG